MKRFLTILAVITAVVLVFTLVGLIQSDRLTTTTYNLQLPKITANLRVVQLSDLHSTSFGKENAELIQAVQAAQPDIIVMTGDMFSWDADEVQLTALLRLIEALCPIAPVCYSLGNHELTYIEENGDAILTRIEASGAVVLEQRFVEMELRGQAVRIGGAYGYLLSRRLRNGAEQRFMEEFTDTELPTILLAHIPHGLLHYSSMEDWDVDLILSGHIHGGQARLPLIGGLYDPETGWFPNYTKGTFSLGGSTLVLSAGLGSSVSLPRFYNPPEIIIVNAVPA